MDKGSSIAHFLKYNNTVPIVLGILFLSTTATMAASPEVQQSVYAKNQTQTSVDNSYIIAVDLSSYPFEMKITNVTEDDEYYYLEYDFHTIDLADGAWQDIVRKSTLRVSKGLLGDGDLQTYAESELFQVRAHELDVLTQVQNKERKIGATQKIIATDYSGLVGKFIDPSQEIVPQYQSPLDPLRLKNPVALVTWDENAAPAEPVIVEKDPFTPPGSYEPPATESTPPPSTSGTTTPPPATTTPPNTTGTTTPPVVDPPPSNGTTTPPVEEPAPEPEREPTPEPAPEPAPEPTPTPEAAP